MGLFIYTEIRPKHINQEEWNEVFNETKTLLNAYKFARINFDIYDGVKRHFLDGNCIEKAEDDYEKWKVSGDLESMRTAESFSLSNRLTDYSSKEYSDYDDILMTELFSKHDDVKSIFYSKTQGEPYHKYVLAIACLLESRFPKDIMVSGDITKEQAIDAVNWANEYLKEEITIPVRTDYKRLYDRLESVVDRHDLLDSVVKLKIDDDEDELLELVKEKFSKEELEAHLLKNLKSYKNICQVGAQKIITSAFKMGYTLEDIINLLFIMNKDNKYEAEDFIKCIAKSDIFLNDDEKKILDFITPKKNNAGSINQMMFNMMLTMKLPMRNTNYHIDINDAVYILKNKFPNVENIDELVTEGYVAAKEILSSLDDSISKAKEEYELETADISVPENMIYYENEDTFAEHISMQVDSIIKFLVENDMVNEVEERLSGNHKKEDYLKKLYSITSRKYAPLKERYDYIDNNMELEDIKKMIAFYLIEGGEYVSAVQKAILYNRQFCEYMLNKL